MDSRQPELSRLTLMCSDHEVAEFTWNHDRQAVTGKTHVLDAAHAPLMATDPSGNITRDRLSSWFKNRGIPDFRPDAVERRTAIGLPKNKRNGRSQAKHLEGARAIRDINNDNWREGNGRKPKADLVREYAAEHPDANHSEIARALGISRPTVIKWLKDVPKDATEPEKPKPDDLYELYNPAMVELRAALDQYSSSASDRGYLSPPPRRRQGEARGR